jgi:uncharacterized protein (TIGR03067 family)
MSRHALLLAAGLSLGFAPAPLPKPDASKVELKKMQGDWVRVSVTAGGDPVVRHDATRVAIAGDRIIYLQGAESVVEYLITLDAGKKPKVFDSQQVAPTASPGRVYPGVYTLEGDTLTVCFSDPGRARPGDLSVVPGRYLEVFKRVRKP